MQRRRIMRAFKIDEISGVDRPAQAGASVTIMKRATPADKSAEAKKRLFGDIVDMLTSETEGHQHGIKCSKYDDGDVCIIVMHSLAPGAEAAHDHPIVRSTDGTYTMGIVAGHTHDIDSAGLASLLLSILTKGDNSMSDKTPEQIAAEAMEKRLARAEAVIGLSTEHREYFDGMEKDEHKNVWLQKSVEERDQALEAAKVAKAKSDGDDPVVYTTMAGVEIRKSVGPLFIQIAKDNDVIAKENKELREGMEHEKLLKRVEAEIPNLTGTVEERAAMLKAIDGIPDKDQRTAAHNVLKAQNEAFKGITTTFGADGTPDDDTGPQAELDKLTTAYAEKNEVSEAVAMSAVTRTEKGAELYAKIVQ